MMRGSSSRFEFDLGVKTLLEYTLLVTRCPPSLLKSELNLVRSAEGMYVSVVPESIIHPLRPEFRTTVSLETVSIFPVRGSCISIAKSFTVNHPEDLTSDAHWKGECVV
jgi:hypothetical protein